MAPNNDSSAVDCSAWGASASSPEISATHPTNCSAWPSAPAANHCCYNLRGCPPGDDVVHRLLLRRPCRHLRSRTMQEQETADRRTPGRMVVQASATGQPWRLTEASGTGQPWWLMELSAMGQPWRLTEVLQEPEQQPVQESGSGTESESEGKCEGQPWVRERVFRWVERTPLNCRATRQTRLGNRKRRVRN